MPIESVYIGEMSAGETRAFAVDYTDKLDSSELLTGTPTIVEVTTTDLTLANKAVSTGSLTILGETVVTGAAVQWTVAAGSSLVGSYTVRVTVSSDATPAQTFVDDYRVEIR